jgi:hypothetical protein
VVYSTFLCRRLGSIAIGRLRVAAIGDARDLRPLNV